MPERIERADAPDEPAVRLPEPARDDLRQRIARLADGHPSSDHYRDADLSRRDGRTDTFRTETDRKEATDAGTSREMTTATRLDERRDTAERASSGWYAPDVRDHPDRPAEDDIRLPGDRERHPTAMDQGSRAAAIDTAQTSRARPSSRSAGRTKLSRRSSRTSPDSQTRRRDSAPAAGLSPESGTASG